MPDNIKDKPWFKYVKIDNIYLSGKAQPYQAQLVKIIDAIWANRAGKFLITSRGVNAPVTFAFDGTVRGGATYVENSRTITIGYANFNFATAGSLESSIIHELSHYAIGTFSSFNYDRGLTFDLANWMYERAKARGASEAQYYRAAYPLGITVTGASSPK